jgi:prepilin-type processing-associated H-X9-DG protein
MMQALRITGEASLMPMKRHLTARVFMAGVAVLALAAVCLLPSEGHAQAALERIVTFPSVGIVRGQSVRFTLFNPNGTPVRAQVRVRHSNGVIVALGDGSVRAGTFQSFDFKHGDIPLPGEAGSDRLQLEASVHISTRERWRSIRGLTVSMETLSIRDGTSNTVLVSEVLPSALRDGGRQRILAGGIAGHTLIGIAPGQTLRVTLSNPLSSAERRDTDAHTGAISGHVRLLDASGAVIAESEKVDLAPDTFRSFDFPREALAFPGEPGTDRLQLRIQPSLESTSPRPRRALASIEVIDGSTGATVVLEGQQCLVFFLGGGAGN